MRIKIIGDNDCARATRQLLRLAGFAVTDFLPGDAVAEGPLAGYAISIDLAPAPHTPNAHLRPDHSTHHSHTSAKEEAPRSHRDASSPSFADVASDKLSLAKAKPGASIHFDSVDSALEDAVLRHVTQLAAAPVILDRPGGMVHSERELRIVAPNTGDAIADETAAVAIEFGVLRGMLDLNSPGAHRNRGGSGAREKFRKGCATDVPEEESEISWAMRWWKRWWPFGVLAIAGTVGALWGNRAALGGTEFKVPRKDYGVMNAALGVPFVAGVMEIRRLKPTPLEPEAQGQFSTGDGLKITDGANFLVVDPCKAHAKLFASISQTGDTQLVAGMAAKKIYVCSIHVVAATRQMWRWLRALGQRAAQAPRE